MRFFKTMLFTGVLTAFFIVSGFNAAHAKFDSCEQWGIGCEEEPGGGSTIVNNDISNRNTNTNINTILVDVDNEIDMDQKQNQHQKQDQDQLQLQGQIGINKNDNSNKGNKQNTDIKIEGDVITYEAEPNHIQGPGLLSSDAKLTKNPGFSFRTMGSVWSDISGISVKAAASLGKGSSDAKVEKALMYEHAALNYIRKATDNLEAVFLGTIYVYPDGDDVTVAGMEGVGLSEAMAAGATHASIQYDSGDVADGSSWNVGLGGGASIVANSNGTVMVAPNGGLGVGGATAFNNKLPALAIKLYYDVTVIK